MLSIKGHFDGKSVVLDEPAALEVGQSVRVVIDSNFSPHRDPIAELMNGEAYDERDALNIDPQDAVPPDFVRQPGSGAGEIWMADDFDETPDDFKEYM